jgi:hypothetical protein
MGCAYGAGTDCGTGSEVSYAPSLRGFHGVPDAPNGGVKAVFRTIANPYGAYRNLVLENNNCLAHS